VTTFLNPVTISKNHYEADKRLTKSNIENSGESGKRNKKRVSFASFSLRSKKMKAVVGPQTDGLDST